jgi:hypothetical protein
MPGLNILTDKEQLEFDYPPTLTVEARAVCFAVDDALDSQIKKLRGETNKVGFLLQYAYFKASRRFFLINRFRGYQSKAGRLAYFRPEILAQFC